jgi:hypothetical protein
MKRVILSVIFLMFAISLVSASCDLDVEIINQDPYPAVPGEYVDVVFQITGVENSDCKDVIFSLSPEYPFSVDYGTDTRVKIKGGTYTQNFNSFLMAPYKVRVDKDAIGGNNTLTVKYSTDRTESSYITKKFDINVDDVETNFEVFIKDYDYTKRSITFEILNSGENDVESLILQVPKQDNIIIKGSSSNIIGALDSNDFTTASFEATPSEGEIKINIIYTDLVNNRRTIEKSVYFQPEYFQERLRDEKSNPTSWYIVGALILLALVFYFYKRHKKKLKRKQN